MHIKAGWKTTEFWLTLASNIVGGLSMVGALPVPQSIKGAASVAGGVVAAVTTDAYAIARAVTKSAAAPAPAVVNTVNP